MFLTLARNLSLVTLWVVQDYCQVIISLHELCPILLRYQSVTFPLSGWNIPWIYRTRILAVSWCTKCEKYDPEILFTQGSRVREKEHLNMEFPFNVNQILPETVTLVDENLAPFREKFKHDRYKHWYITTCTWVGYVLYVSYEV